MKIIFPEINNLNVNIDEVYIGECQPWGEKYWHSHFKLTISRNGEEYTTDYYSVRGLTCFDASDAANALQCVIMDANCYIEATDIDDFCQNLGFTTDHGIRRILDAYKGCQESAEAIERLGLTGYAEDVINAIDCEEYEAEED